MTDNHTIDYEADAASSTEGASATPAGVAIEDEIRRALTLEQKIADLEQEVKVLKKELKGVMEVALPEFMAGIGLSEFGTKDGSRVALGPLIYGTLNNAPDIEAAIQYLENNGLEGGVLTDLHLRYTEAEREAADSIAQRIHEISDKDVIVERKINPSTLRAYVRQRIVEDPAFDPAIVGCTVTTAAKFTKRGTV